MRQTAVLATLVVMVNLVIGGVHGFSHTLCAVRLEKWQEVFVLLNVFAIPLLAMGLYWIRYERAASWLLLMSMLAGTSFGIYFHFVADTVDHVSHRDAYSSGALFVVSAVLLIPAGLSGVVLGIWNLFRQTDRRTAA